jgi:ATPase family AAA domain-containing protein 3A/B
MQEESQRQAQLAQYNDELARKRQQAEHELQRQRNGELVALQEQAAARKEAERLRIEQQIQAERRSADQHAVREEGLGATQGEWGDTVADQCVAAVCSMWSAHVGR